MAASPKIKTLTVVGPGRAVVQRFTLTVTGGPDAGKSLRSRGERATLGTAPTADVVLADPTVSRFHCEVVLADERAAVRDLGSRNGTRVDGVGVEHGYLKAGSVLSVGRSTVRFELGADEVEIPLSRAEHFGSLVGRSPAMRAVFHALGRAAATDSTVLLLGETGTGKELAAESIHRASKRGKGPFLVIDCGAIPPALLESELFGHERGAFTGAIGTREGVFEAAAGGTVFLDEIGELPAELQPKLLRVLEKREVKRLGKSAHTPVDVRVVAATHRNLRAEVNRGTFRSDLYYRLAVLEVGLPPLREHLEDLPFLVEHILQDLGAADRPEAALLTANDFLAAVAAHAWPGNVRELRNYLERCLALGEEAPLQTQQAADAGAGLTIDVDRPLREARDAWVSAFERRYLEAALRKADGNVRAAARKAGVDRIHFYRLLWRHGLK